MVFTGCVIFLVWTDANSRCFINPITWRISYNELVKPNRSILYELRLTDSTTLFNFRLLYHFAKSLSLSYDCYLKGQSIVHKGLTRIFLLTFIFLCESWIFIDWFRQDVVNMKIIMLTTDNDLISVQLNGKEDVKRNENKNLYFIHLFYFRFSSESGCFICVKYQIEICKR